MLQNTFFQLEYLVANIEGEADILLEGILTNISGLQDTGLVIISLKQYK